MALLSLTALEAELNRNTDVDASAIILITKLADEVEANKNDPAALQVLVDKLRADNDKLAAAVANETGVPVPPVFR